MGNFPFRHEAPPIPDHEVLRCIGKGSYGEVWMARGLTGSLRAVKVVHRKDFELEKTFEREFEGLRAYEPIARESPYLVDILHVGRNTEHSFYYYVMELADDEQTGQEIIPAEYVPLTLGSEVKRRGKVPLDECLTWGISLCRGLGYLHERGLAHRDIKPSNVIFVKGLAMLADIGLVAESGGEQSYVGTDGFVPPEGPGTEQADIFSLGMVLYEISTGLDRLEFPALPEDFTNSKERDRMLALNEVFCRACAPSPKRRFQTAAAMAEELRSIAAGEYLPSRLPQLLTLPVLAVGLATFIVNFAGGDSVRLLTGPAPELPASIVNAPAPERQKFAEIVLQSEPPGAEIWLDGKKVGKTPEPLSMAGGNYEFVLKRPRYKDEKVIVSARRGEQINLGVVNMRFSDPPKPGQSWTNHLGMVFEPGESGTWVAAEPTTYQQFIQENGELLEGEVIPWKLRNDKQGYIVYVPHTDIQGFCEWLRREDLKEGFLAPDFNYRYEIVTDNVLDRVDDVRGTFHAFRCVVYRQEFGELTITSEPSGAEVYDEGVYIGQTPLKGRRTEAGERKLELRLAGYQIEPYSLTLSPGGSVNATIPLSVSSAVEFGRAWGNSLRMRFVPVGDPVIENFLVGAHEVRKRDFNAFINATGATPPPKPKFQQGGVHPVVNVTRSDAEEFCRWLTNHERENERIGLGDTYRLPTDAEWSTAAGAALERGDSPADRGGRTFGVYPWGVQWPPPAKAGNFADKTYRISLGRSRAEAIPGYNDGVVYTAPTGKFKGNTYRIFDVAGNVWEWVSDSYGGADADAADLGVIRGASWRDFEKDDLGLGRRRSTSPETRAENIGFRVVLSRGTTPVETLSGVSETD